MIKKIESFLFRENYSKIPFIFWLSPAFVVFLHAVLFFKEFPIAPYLLVFALFALVASTRYHLKGLLGSALALAGLSFLLRDLIPAGATVYYLAYTVALGSSFMIQSFVSEVYEEFLMSQSKEALSAKEDQKLWKSRFENAQIKFEKEKELFEKAETAFQREEDEFIETMASMKQLLSISHRENQKILSQNDRLMDENKGLEAFVAKSTLLEEELLKVRADLNELRVQAYQDRLLYQNLREEAEKELDERPLVVSPTAQNLVAEEIQFDLNKKEDETTQENIYLTHS